MLCFPDGQSYHGEEDEDHSTSEFEMIVGRSQYRGYFKKGLFTGNILNPQLYGGSEDCLKMYEGGKWVCTIDVEPLPREHQS